MIVEQMLSGNEVTLRLAPVIGGYLVFSSIGLSRSKTARAFTADLASRPGALHAVGAIAFFAGAVLLSFNRHWTTAAEIVLNLVGLWWLFEGAGLLADPDRLRALMADEATARWMRRSQAVAILVGIYLVVVGLFGHVR